MKFPEILENFTYPINFPTQGHVIFPGKFPRVSDILHVMYIFK